MSDKRFSKSFTQQEPLPEAAMEKAIAVMQSGRLHRYNTSGDEWSEASLLEKEFAEYQGRKYCLACTSGGYAIHVALRAAGVSPGDKVLMNAYTLAPVPGAVYQCGARPVLVEIDDHYHVDIQDLRTKARESGARYFLMSHMRGHIADMDAVMQACAELGLILIEDCAHTMGAAWNGTLSGNFGLVACFSTQTYKHINSGEGGLLVTDDPELAAKAILYSGSYMLFEKHGARPPREVFEALKLDVPNFSGRMDNLRAAILRPQIKQLDADCARWNALYHEMEGGLREIPGIDVPERHPREAFVGSSIQFRVEGLAKQDIPDFLAECEGAGVALKWFGEDEPRGYTSRFDSWHYLGDLPDLPRTREILSHTFDMRLPLTFAPGDCRLICDIIGEALMRVRGLHPSCSENESVS